MTSRNRTEKVKSYAEWIAPSGGLESLANVDPAARDVRRPPWATDEEMELAIEGAVRIDAGQELDPVHAVAIEAIILPQERPVVDVVGGTFARPAAVRRPGRRTGEGQRRGGDPGDRPHRAAGPARAALRRDRLRRRRRTAHDQPPRGRALRRGSATSSCLPSGQRAGIDFLRERDSPASPGLPSCARSDDPSVLGHGAAGRRGLPRRTPLRLATADPRDLRQRKSWSSATRRFDPRNDADLQNRIFGSTYNVKRLQPGKLARARRHRELRQAGAAADPRLLDARRQLRLGGGRRRDRRGRRLHFGGRYLKANYAVPGARAGARPAGSWTPA